MKLKHGTKVKVISVPDNVANDVKSCVGCTGKIVAYGSPSDTGEQGYYVRIPGHPTKRFYESELQRI